MNTFSRRDWLKMSALSAAALPFAGLPEFAAAQTAAADPWRGLKIGVATYTVRELPIEEAIKGVQRVGLKYVSIKNVKNHVDLSHTPEERKARAKMFRDAGMVPLSVGNVSMRTGEADIRKAFEYARDIGVTTIVCAPSQDAIPILDKMVKEFDIKLAIHNHGPEDKGFFPSPYDVWKAVEKFDYDHFRAEARVHAAEFQSDHSGADHHQMRGNLPIGQGLRAGPDLISIHCDPGQGSGAASGRDEDVLTRAP